MLRPSSYGQYTLLQLIDFRGFEEDKRERDFYVHKKKESHK